MPAFTTVCAICLERAAIADDAAVEFAIARAFREMAGTSIAYNDPAAELTRNSFDASWVAVHAPTMLSLLRRPQRCQPVGT